MSGVRNVKNKAWWSLSLLVIALVMAACAGPLSEEPELADSPPLITDADIDAAVLELAESEEELTPTYAGMVPDAAEVEPEDVDEDLAVQATLAGASGRIAYVRYSPGKSDPWRIVLADQSNDQKTVVYAGKRDIDSVAVSRNGNVVVFSMRLDSGRRQVFRFTVSSRTLKRLTFHGDDVSVSMSANGSTVVWVRYEDWGCDDGCPSIKIREYSGGSYTQRTVRGGNGASVSGDGNYIVYVTDEDATNFEIWLYNKLNNTRTAVTKPGGFMRYPSVNNGGTKIAYLLNDYGESPPVDYVRVKDLTTGKTRNVVSYRYDRGVYEPIHHPHLTADGNFITYVLNTNDRSSVFTKNLSTGRVARTDTRLLPKRHYAPYWQK